MEERAASRHLIRWIALVVTFALAASGLGVLTAPDASAGIFDKPYEPVSGFQYSLDKRAGMWKDCLLYTSDAADE